MSDVVRLEYRNVTMRFAATGNGGVLTAVQGVSFSVRDGEVVSLIGPSGCGKSTLLNIGSGLTAPSDGEAFVDGERVAGPNAHVAFMLQKDLLLPWRTVDENVMFGVEIQGVPAAERRQRAQALLGKFQPRGILRSLSAPIVRRHAPARGAGAHARGRSPRAAARRAVLGGRRADPHGAAARSGADAEARGQDRAADHPRSAGGGDPVRPRAGDEPAAGPHHRRDHDRHAGPRQSDRAAPRSQGQRLRRAADGSARYRPRSLEQQAAGGGA